MKKIANFIVQKRSAILIVFAMITLCSVWLMTKVTINYDMTKYLPKDSSTKAGLEVMDAEFPAANSVYVMFKGLSGNEKSDIYKGLSEIHNVQSVSYEADSEEYNKDDYTLYIVSMDFDAYSSEARGVVAAINEQYSTYDITTSGEAAGIMDLTFIFIPAVAILIVILFLMSKSWFEPLILIGNIGVAVIINMGTNAIFDSVSEITQAIAAVLQLVLSMDYSIMLINRYRQEKELTDNKYDAMKKALHGAFAAISSSSVTTIVGMLMLVFMSFTIGMDLGLVLAKGVFFSLLCVFTVMPALVVVSDKIIERTAKPSLHFGMNKVASFAYSARYIILAVFIGLFAGGFAMRGNVGINYSMDAFDEVYNVFTPGNPIVVLYENKDEGNIASLAERWDENSYVESVDAYATTLGKEQTGAEIADAAGMDKTMVDLLYYCYFNGKTIFGEKEILFSDFMRFIADDIASNKMFFDYFNEESLAQLNMLSVFTDKNTINMPLDANAIGTMLGMDAAMVEQIFFMRSGGTGEIQTIMSVYEFARFVLSDLATNPNFIGSFDPTALQQLGFLYSIMDATQTDRALTSAEMTDLLGSSSDMINKDTVDLLYLFYFSKQNGNPDWKLSAYDFIGFIVNDIVNDRRFSGFFTDDAIQELTDNMYVLEDGLKHLVGTNFSRAVINTTFPEESDETFDFVANIHEELRGALSGEYFIIGNSAMAYEMAMDFPSELDFITILTAVSIFLVVMIAFRSLSVPLILVCLIQCAVFITMGTIYIQGSSIYYLALLIVQCLMMGATIDYGLLYTSYYREARASVGIKESMIAALNNTIHTVMTSGLILVTITLVLGILFAGQNYAISEILLIIARGCFCAMILVVFILPSLLAVLDRFVVKKKRETDSQKTG